MDQKEFIPFLAILSHQCLKGFHGGCFNLLEPIERIHASNGIKDIVALCHLHWGEVARSFGNTGFICHVIVSRLSVLDQDRWR